MNADGDWDGGSAAMGPKSSSGAGGPGRRLDSRRCRPRGPLHDGFEPNRRDSVVFWEVRVLGDFLDLGDVALGVGGDEQDPLIGVQFGEQRVRREMAAEVFAGVADEGDGPVAALFEVLDKGVAGGPSPFGLEEIGGLRLAAAVEGGADDSFVLLLLLGGDLFRGRGRFQDLGGDELKQGVLAEGDMFGDLGDGPAAGAGLKPPLGVGEVGDGVEEHLPGGVQVAHGAIAFAAGERGGGQDGGKEATESELSGHGESSSYREARAEN